MTGGSQGLLTTRCFQGRSCLAAEALEEAMWGFALHSADFSSKEDNQEGSPSPQHCAGYHKSMGSSWEQRRCPPPSQGL